VNDFIDHIRLTLQPVDNIPKDAIYHWTKKETEYNTLLCDWSKAYSIDHSSFLFSKYQ
jgi:hypothetical protein